MDDILNFSSIKEYNTFNNSETLHPLVSVVDLQKADPRKLKKMRYGFYTVFLKQIYCGDLRYGLGNYDYEEGTLIFLAPGQVIGENKNEQYQPQGTALVFHPDFIIGTSLGKHISEYHFFSYAAVSGQQYMNANDSNPKNMSWMKGFPPKKDSILSAVDGSFFVFPALRCADRWRTIKYCDEQFCLPFVTPFSNYFLLTLESDKQNIIFKNLYYGKSRYWPYAKTNRNHCENAHTTFGR